MRQQIWLGCTLLAGSWLPAGAQPPAPAPPATAAPAPPAAAASPRAPRARTMVRVRHGGSGYLGVGVEEIDHERAQALGLREEHGVEIRSVEEGSPAAQAGLKVGDVVLDYNGQRVEGVEQFTRMVGETPAGRRCALGIWRNHAGQTLSATLATRTWPGLDEEHLRELDSRMKDLDVQLKHLPMPEMPMLPKPTMGWQMGVLGIEGEELNPQLAEYFGVKEGVLVRAVVHGSAAEHAGLKAGDVITKIDGTVVTTPREISSLMRGSRGKATTSVTVFRSRKEMTLEVKKGERSQGEPPRPGALPL